MAKPNLATKSASSFGFLKALTRMLIIVFIVGASSAGWLFWQEWQLKTQAIDTNSSTIASLKSSVNLAKNQAQTAIEQQQQQKKRFFSNGLIS